MFKRLMILMVVVLLNSSVNAAKQPNFVFFLVDDLGWADLGCYGSTFYETPNIDRLARSGVRFTQAYAACHVCSPTRASIMTGKHPVRVDITNFIYGQRSGMLKSVDFERNLALEEKTIAESLKDAGYATCFAGKWHLGDEGYWPENQGFDLNIGGFNKGMPPSYFAPWNNPRLVDGPDGEHLADRLAKDCNAFIEANKDEPFFVYLSFYSVHTPLRGKPELVQKYKEKAAGLPEVKGPRWIDEGEFNTARQVQDHAVYAAMMETMDANVGRVLDKINSLGLSDDTIILFMSDNGGLSTSEGQPTSNLPLRGGKGWHFEGGIREPMLVRWPGVTKAGTTCDVPVVSMDFYPTMLEMAGLNTQPKQHVDGKSMVGLLKGGDEELHKAMYWHYPHYSNQGDRPAGAIRVGDYKLIEYFEDGEVLLFNLANDLGEHENLAAKMPRRVKALQAQLHRWQKNQSVKFPVKNVNWDPKAQRAKAVRKK